VERYLPLARHLALRYVRAGQSVDDVFQVACLALVKAIDRFDPDRGVAFSSYAVPTVLGEVKRYFRDTTWAVHVPRDLQENSLRIGRAVSELASRLGRQPTVEEVARFLGCAEDEVLEGLQATEGYRATSLDCARRGDDQAHATLGETIAYDDQRFDTVERRADLSALTCRLSAKEQAALWLRFDLGLTQSEIGRVLGVSQVEVSRILRRAFAHLRALHAHATREAGRTDMSGESTRGRGPRRAA
jgi:RNA polymerase sigma-B factor